MFWWQQENKDASEGTATIYWPPTITQHYGPWANLTIFYSESDLPLNHSHERYKPVQIKECDAFLFIWIVYFQ
jgi:hypothetical protein